MNQYIPLQTMSNFKSEIRNTQFLSDDMYSEISESEYMVKVNINNFTNFELNRKILKIIIGGNVEIKYLGYNNYEPNKDDEEKEIK